MDQSGNAIAIWSRSNGVNTIIQASYKPSNGIWESPINLSFSGQDASAPQIAMDQNGNAIAIWARADNSDTIIQARHKPNNKSWRVTENLSIAGQDTPKPQIAINPNGNAIAVWEKYDGFNYVIQAISKPANGFWETAEDLFVTGKSSFNPQIAMDPSGNAIAVWERDDRLNYIIQASFRPANDFWQFPVTISEKEQNASTPQIAMDPNGNAIVVWTENNGFNDIIQASYKPANDTWGPPQNISAGDQDAADPQVSIDQNGTAIAVWERNDMSHDIIQTSSKPAHELFGTPKDLSETGHTASYPQIAMDSNGNAIAVWERNNGSNYIIQARKYFAAPTVTSIVPATGCKSGGTLVTITGTNFLNASDVFFGTIPATHFSPTSNTMIVAKAPSGNGTVLIAIVSNQETSAISRNAFFTYKTPLPPQKPKHFKGKIYKLHHGKNHKYYKIYAHWAKSTTPDVSYYNIYRNNKIWNVVQANQKRYLKILQYTHRLHKKYEIAAVSPENIESKKISLRTKGSSASLRRK